MKKILSLLLAVIMVMSLVPLTVFATGTSYAITNGSPEDAKETNHGYITIDKTSAAENETVTVTVNPAEGYQLKSLTVTPEYTVTFDLNGITGTAPETQKVAKDGKVTKPTDPTFANHTFAGWYKTKDATTGALSDPWDFDNDTVTADMTLYAQWTRTLGSIYGTNENVPKADNNTAPDDAWENGDGGKAFIAHSGKTTEVLYFYKKLEPSGAKQLSCRKTENFTKIGDDYVLDYYYDSTFLGKYTLHMTDGKFTSVTYNGAGTDYEVLSGTYAPPVSVTSVSLDKIEVTIEVGDEDVKLPATVLPENATNKAVNWSSSNESVATVDNEGNVHAIAAGEATITVTTVDGNKTSTCAVKVVAPASNPPKSPSPKSLTGPSPKSLTGPSPDPEITPAKQTDGTYQFTMPGYAVTVTAEFEEKAITVDDILPDDFPTYSSGIPDNVWKNSVGSKMYINNKGLTFGGVNLYNILSKPVTKDGNNYKYISNPYTITFVMDSDKLVKVITEGAENADNNGEYIPSHTHNPVKVTGQAATEEAAGWKDYYKCDCSLYFEDEACITLIGDGAALATWKTGEGALSKLVHTITPVNGKNATDTEAGYKAYYECKNCGKHYEDATGLIEITDIDAWKSQTGDGYLPKLKRYYDTITIGGNKDKAETKAEEAKEENPNTGAPVMNLGAVAVILGAAYIVSKKH